MIRVVALSVLVFVGAGASAASAQGLDAEVTSLAVRLAEQLVPRQKPKVVVIDLADLQGRMSELGRYLADQLSIELVMQQGVTVVDRANLRAVMAEHRLTAEGLVDPENAKKLGKFIGVDALILGTLSTMDKSVMASVRAVATETAELVAAGRMRFDLTDDAKRMLGMGVSGGALPVSGAPPLAAAVDSSMPTVVAGPVSVSVKNVTTRREGSSKAPVVQVTLIVSNPRLDSGVAIAANTQILRDESRAKAPKEGLVRSQLQGSEMAWVIGPSSLRGLPVVAGFDVVYRDSYWLASIDQTSPGNVVDYIRRGIEYTGGDVKEVTQRMWTGSFARVDPGGHLELVATFTPKDGWIQRDNDLAFRPSAASVAAFQRAKWPSTVSLSFELVLATVTGDESPQRASSLALRNVTIENIPLPPVR